MPFEQRERIILITVVLVLVTIAIFGYARRRRWEREYTMIVEQVTVQISITDATTGELESLPGIGPGLARRIIDYRDAHGPFSSLDELKNVRGIGEKKFKTILPYIRL